MSGDFETLVGQVLHREGGYIVHKADRGGATNMGITQRTYSMWRNDTGRGYQDIRALTLDEAVEIYRANYWTPARCDDLPREIRDLHFDAAVNHGVSRAGKMLQAACGVTQDGVVGPATLGAIAGMDMALLRARYINARYRFYGEIVQRDRSQFAFIAGWMRRMEDFA